MTRLGSTTSPRARQMRQVLARWERSGLTLREFGQQHGIVLSTLTWWRRVFQRAGEPMKSVPTSAPAAQPVVFTEVPRAAPSPIVPPVLEIVLRGGQVLRVPTGADTDTLQRVLQALRATC